MFRKLRNSFLVLNLAATSIMMLAAFGAIYLVTWTYVQRDIDRELARIAESGRRPVGRPGLPRDAAAAPEVDLAARGAEEPPPRAVPPTGPDRSVSFAVIADADGSVTSWSSFLELDEAFYAAAAAAALSQHRRAGSFRLDDSRWAFLATPVPEGTRIAFLDVSAQWSVLGRLVTTSAIAAAVMLVLIALASAYFAERAIAPIREAFERQKRFVADASHELRTPLTTITTNVDVLLANAGGRIGEHAKWLGYIKAESERLAKLTDELLYLTRMDRTDAKQVHAALDASGTVQSAVLTMEAVFFEKGIALRHEIEPGLRVAGDRDEITQLAMILLDNALKYAGDGGAVEVRMERRRHAAHLSVTNTGEGIAAEHLPRIFDRFYRADPSRARGAGGCGLGLAIAKAIVDRHRGRIAAHSVPGASTTFSVEIPLLT